MLFYDEQGRRQLCRERASELARDYRRPQRLPRDESRPASSRRIVFRRDAARRAPAYRA